MRNRPVRRFRPAVEHLEAREVPANFTAATVPELIAAVDASNLTPEADTLTLAANTTFTLTTRNNFSHGNTGLPVIANGEDLTVIGNGSTIERSTAAGVLMFRLFDVASGASLTMENLTLQGGNSESSSGTVSRGGAILNQGTLTLHGVTVRNNRADGGTTNGLGGGVYSDGVLVMNGCTIQGNVAQGGVGNSSFIFWGQYTVPHEGYDGLGGGLFVAGGSVSISNSTITGNLARGGNGGDGASVWDGADGGDGFGGGMYVGGGAVSLHGVSLTSNKATGGNGGSGGTRGDKGTSTGGGIFIEASAVVGLDEFTVGHVKKNQAKTGVNIFGSYQVIP